MQTAGTPPPSFTSTEISCILRVSISAISRLKHSVPLTAAAIGLVFICVDVADLAADGLDTEIANTRLVEVACLPHAAPSPWTPPPLSFCFQLPQASSPALLLLTLPPLSPT